MLARALAELLYQTYLIFILMDEYTRNARYAQWVRKTRNTWEESLFKQNLNGFMFYF